MPRYTPSHEDQLRVRELSTIGASHEDIAAELSLPSQKVQKLFKRELQQGAAQGKVQALTKLHEIAVAGENFSALSFYVKARCGWRDTGTPAGETGAVRHILWVGDLEKERARPSV